MKRVLITSLLEFIAAASGALAAEVEPVITPGPFAPPPAFPTSQVNGPTTDVMAQEYALSLAMRGSFFSGHLVRHHFG